MRVAALPQPKRGETIDLKRVFFEPVHPKYLPKQKCIRYFPIHSEEMSEIPVRRFQEITHTHYLDHLAFDCKETYEKVKELCKEALEKEVADKRTEWNGFRYRKEVLSGFVNDVYIRWVDNRFGFGLFANKKIEKGEFIGEYVGLVRPITSLFPDVNSYCFRYPLKKISYRVYTIDAQDMFNETSFINHSNHPNCDALVAMNNSLLHVCIVANANVEKGEQLTYDYGNSLRTAEVYSACQMK